VRLPRSGQGTSPGGGDFQPKQGRGGEAAPRARHNTKNARSPSAIETTTASKGGRRGSLVSPPMKICCPSCRGAATLQARRSTGATCRGRPHRRLPAALKCRRRDSRRRPRATRLLARACDKQLALPERTSGRSALVWRPAGRTPPSCRDPHPAKPTPREDRRSGRPPPASFTTAPSAPTLTPCRGIDRGGSSRTRRRRRARRRRWVPTLPRGACRRYLSGAAEPRTFTCPSSPAGAKVQPQPSQRPEGQPPEQVGSMLPPLRRWTEAEQPPSWRA
jgi:hypothetical protein